jgi:hypothetical protein
VVVVVEEEEEEEAGLEPAEAVVEVRRLAPV